MDDAYRRKLEGHITYVLMRVGVTGPEIDECIEWAFGKGAWYVPPYPDWLNRWRKLHPEIAVKKSDSFNQFIAVVGALFITYKKRKYQSMIN